VFIFKILLLIQSPEQVGLKPGGVVWRGKLKSSANSRPFRTISSNDNARGKVFNQSQ